MFLNENIMLAILTCLGAIAMLLSNKKRKKSNKSEKSRKNSLTKGGRGGIISERFEKGGRTRRLSRAQNI